MIQGKFNLTQKGLILVAIPLVLELVFFGSLIYLLNETERERNEAEHARQLIGHTNAVIVMIYNAISELAPVSLGASDTVTDDKEFQEKLIAIHQEYESLLALAITPKEEADIQQFGAAIDHGIDVIGDVHRLLGQIGKDLGSFQQLHKRRKQIVKLVRDIKEQVGLMLGPEMEIERQGPEKARLYADLLKGIIYAGIGGNILLALVGWRLFSHHIVKRLDTLYANSRKIAMGEALPDVVPGADEISDLDVALHEMADALKEAAEVERALTDNVSDVICSLDSNNRFVALNPACAELWGYDENELLGMNVREIIVAEDADKVTNSLTKGQGESKNFDTRVKLKNGEEADMHWTANWSPKQQSYFCVVHDISAAKQVERMKKEFVAMVSHDLRTPLNSVLNLLTLMSVDAYGAVNETGHKRLDAAEQDITRLIGLINELLDLEKLEAGEVILDLKEISASSIMQQAQQSVYGFAQQNSVEIVCEPSTLYVTVDQNRFVQLLINLLSNAVKFSEKGAEVRMQAVRGANYTVFEVSDTGCGIPPEVQSTIFERYKQAEGANKKHKGTGLGLAICKNIAEQHGGSIGVDSTVGFGSKFWVKIPDRPGQKP
ncbi:MAG: PAS domain S-box protein [Cyanobacteria bacterium SZAS-4]|nr:PAS domain S-box protein [Cyanobacteria bacterium SZAS-4]